ncbi:MAG: CDP-glucose 4,6-dehydratase [Deltaproteobacteria bacterium RIFCSPLOWO2_02_FULL_46_8]|nr:MAG: CDP-glucose 4,6-dehydratase [Deltaproteobacteria bacterium RIFCSPLOWO2_02_FULL_46_8]
MNHFWKKKRVLITGNTGFKGSWLSIWLKELGAELMGVALKPKQELDNFCVSRLNSKLETRIQDIRDFEGLEKIFKEFNPEIVIHLAAQALVATAYEQPKMTFETNVLGTLNVLEAIRNCKTVKSAVLITSDKCYKNVEQIWGYRENDVLGGDDPYSASKGAAELTIHSYMRCYFNGDQPLIASARAGNVIGGGDWSENRIVPDCFRSFFSKNPIVIRNPEATRPWQFVLEPLRGYLMLAEKLFHGLKEFSGHWNFGPSLEKDYSVSAVAKEIVKNWKQGEIIVKRDNKVHESALLQLDCTKARKEIGWEPLLTFEECMKWTTNWYRHLYEDGKRDMYDVCVNQIRDFERIQANENKKMPTL